MNTYLLVSGKALGGGPPFAKKSPGRLARLGPKIDLENGNIGPRLRSTQFTLLGLVRPEYTFGADGRAHPRIGLGGGHSVPLS